MPRFLGFLAALLLTFAAAAQSVQHEPVAPTTRDAVTLDISIGWAYFCDPDAVNVDVADHTVTVTIVAKRPECFAGFPVIYGWSGKRTIGPLPAGTYTVTSRLDVGSAPTNPAPQPSFVVRDVSGPLTVITPDVLPSMTKIALHDEVLYRCLSSQNPCPPITVRAGNVTATSVTSTPLNDFIATFPTLQPGTYDVSISYNDHAATAVAALTVIDPNAAVTQQAASLERVLVPLLFSGPGAFGSQWTTEVAITNAADVPLDIFKSPFTNSAPLEPGETRTLTTADIGQRPTGLFLYIPRGEDRSLQFNALVRDLSRQGEQLGAEMPSVRESEFFHQRFNLMNVPSDSRYRVALRTYALGAAPIILSIYRMGDASLLVRDTLQVGTPSSTQPANVIIPDLVSKYPQLADAGSFRVEIQRPFEGTYGPFDPGIWAFISVTNNETQHVTIISPQ